MILKNIEFEQIKGLHKVDGKEMNLDFDRYNVEIYSGLSTKEYSVVVDFIHNEISGDYIAFGGWHNMEKDQCCFILDLVNKNMNKFSDEYFISSRNFDDLLAEDLWTLLVDVPFDENENTDLILAEKYHIFDVGTLREDIWHYLDELHSKGLKYLMLDFEIKY